MFRKTSSQKEFSRPGQWCSHHPQKCSKKVWTWHLGRRVSGGLGSVGQMVGLKHLRGFSNLNNSLTLTHLYPTLQGYQWRALHCF